MRLNLPRPFLGGQDIRRPEKSRGPPEHTCRYDEPGFDAELDAFQYAYARSFRATEYFRVDEDPAALRDVLDDGLPWKYFDPENALATDCWVLVNASFAPPDDADADVKRRRSPRRAPRKPTWPRARLVPCRTERAMPSQ